MEQNNVYSNLSEFLAICFVIWFLFVLRFSTPIEKYKLQISDLQE